MGFIRAVINLAILAGLVVLGYWLYATFVTAPNAPYWAEINRNLPGAMRRFSCEQIRQRQAAGPIETCEGQ